MNVKRWLKMRIDLRRMQRVLGIRLKRFQRKAALMDKSPIEVLREWGRGTGKTTIAIIWMALHEERNEIRMYGRSRMNYPAEKFPNFIPDPDISTVQQYNFAFKEAKRMCEMFKRHGIRVPELVF